MPITGSQKALMYAQGGSTTSGAYASERCGATRTGYHSPKPFVMVGGIHRATARPTESEVVQDLSITLTRSVTPNKASFTAQGWIPTVGMEVIAQLGSTNTLRRLFGGTVIDVDETSKGILRQFSVECIDWNWLLDDEPIYGHFTGTYDEIAIELMADAPTGFTTTQVESGLDTVPGGITFTGVKRSVALNRLAKRGGIVQFIDEFKDLYFRVTPAVDRTNPTNIIAGLDTLKKFRVRRDLSQIANRVPFEGGGSNALTEVEVGETILPLTDAPDWWYGDVGGVVLSGPQKISYTARVEGGASALVGEGAAPATAPGLALHAGVGLDVGTARYKLVFRTALGPTLPGPIGRIVVGIVSAPSAAVIAGTPSSGGSMNVGSHRYYPVFRNATGSTTPGPVSNSVTVEQTSPPTAIGAASSAPGGGVSLLAPNSLYAWKFTFCRLLDDAETTPSPSVSTTTNASGSATVIALSGCSAAPSGFVRRWYRTVAGGVGAYKRCDDPLASSSREYDGYFNDGSADASLGANAPATNGTAKGTCLVSDIPISPDSLITFVDVYREFNEAGAATAQLAFSVANGTTSATDTVANASLGALVPASNTATANQVSVSFPAGPTGTTDIEIYRNSGIFFRLLHAVGSNTGGTFVDDVNDISANALAPVADTSGLEQTGGQVAENATEIPCSNTVGFEDDGGFAIIGNGRMIIRFTGKTSNALTGVPDEGLGRVTGPIAYNQAITQAPQLTGVPASGDGSIETAIQKGDAVNLLVTVEDTDAQAYLQALVDADGPVVRECPPLQDRRVSRNEALARAQAFLTLRAYPGVRVGPYLSKDMNNRPGSEVNLSISSPASVNETLELHSVTISNFTPAIAPDYTVQASNETFAVEAVLSKEP